MYNNPSLNIYVFNVFKISNWKFNEFRLGIESQSSLFQQWNLVRNIQVIPTNQVGKFVHYAGGKVKLNKTYKTKTLLVALYESMGHALADYYWRDFTD